MQSRLNQVEDQLQHVEAESNSRQETIAQLNTDLSAMEDKIEMLEGEKTALQTKLNIAIAAIAAANSASTSNTAVTSFGRLNEID